MLFTERQEPRRKRRRRRPSILPPPSLPGTPFEGAVLLDELPDSFADLLWHAARDVQLWHTVTVLARPGLFGDGNSSPTGRVTRLIPELSGAFTTFAAVTAFPESMERRSVAGACVAVYNWARARDFLVTATHFAELAAHVLPRESTLATAAGRANRHQAAYARAQRWFDRAVMIARKKGDQAAYAEALVTWGNMAFQQAEYDTARKLFDRAWKKGMKYNVRGMAAAARHNLLALDFVLGDYEAANEHAAAAFALYGRDSDRLPYLAHDVAHLWATEGYFELALSVVAAAEPLIAAPGEQLKVWANIGRAAAGAGRVDLFDDAWERVTREAKSSASPHLPEAILAIAEGAYRLGRTARAVEMAERAVQAARQRGNADAEKSATATLERIRGGAPASPRAHPPDTVRSLAARLLRALT
jgi:tetratricopeptide (TPR) repeat protein